MRNEADVFVPRITRTDPYTLWLEQREAERRHDEPQIRWVYRPASEARTAEAPNRQVLTPA
ncbi:MAG TPA: hypothetical protein VHT27_07040 [Solirubrobacteraceae bacterium]|jgi:hypothetical protein|nr:hypothetical protein [Solirubrobacteraceae bacterium]